MAELVRQLLGCNQAGADDSFFDLGGHSLLAPRLMALIHAEFGVTPPISLLFDTATVAGIAAWVEAAIPRGTSEWRDDYGSETQTGACECREAKGN